MEHTPLALTFRLYPARALHPHAAPEIWALLRGCPPCTVYPSPVDTKQCRQVIADRQAHAVIPPRKNAKPWKDTKSSSLERESRAWLLPGWGNPEPSWLRTHPATTERIQRLRELADSMAPATAFHSTRPISCRNPL